MPDHIPDATKIKIVSPNPKVTKMLKRLEKHLTKKAKNMKANNPSRVHMCFGTVDAWANKDD